MYKTILVKQMIEDGAQLLRRLDERGVPVRAAAWFDDPEKAAWKLVIVTSVAANPGPLEAYMQIQHAMSGMNLSVALDDITVMSPSSQKLSGSWKAWPMGKHSIRKASPEAWHSTMRTSTGGWRNRPKFPV